MLLCRFAKPSIAIPALSVCTLSYSDLLYIAVTVPPGSVLDCDVAAIKDR